MSSTLLALLFLLVAVSTCNTSGVSGAPAQEGLTGRLEKTGMMRTARSVHTATLLNDGRVLIAGGFGAGQKSLASTEIYDPATKTFSAGPDMSSPRHSHSATRLPDGRVLIAGGYDTDYLDNAEIFDPKTNRFTPTVRMPVARSGHQAVLLNNGKVLIVGGVGSGWSFLASAELFDPLTNSFRSMGSMTTPRESHTATLLKNGQVLITGGHRGRRAAMEIFSSTEIYDPVAGTFSTGANLKIKRHKHDAVLLSDGRVLVAGGSDERDSQGAYKTAEIFDPKTKEFRNVADMNLARYKLQGTSVLQNDGRVLIAGGNDQAEIFDPTGESFRTVPGKVETKLRFSTATLLVDGRTLIVGGYNDDIVVSSAAWLFHK